MIEDSGVWFQQTFREGIDTIDLSELESRALDHTDSHEFFMPPFPAGIRCGKQPLAVPCRWVNAWDVIRNETFVRFDVMGKLKRGKFFAKFCGNLTAYAAGSDGPGIRIWWAGGTVSDVSLKDWLEGDYSWA